MLKQFDAESDTPELIWDGSMRSELRKVVAENLDSCIEKRQTGVADDEKFTISDAVRVSYKKLDNELHLVVQ